MMRLLAMLALTFALAAPALRADEELLRFAQRNQILAQKLAADVEQALADSRRLERSSPAQAQAALERLVAEVSGTPQVAEETRARLLQQLRARLREVAEVSRRQRLDQELGQKSDPAPRIVPAPTPIDPPAARTPAKDDAARLAESYIQGARANLEATNKRNLETAKGFSGVMNNLSEAAAPATRDLTLAKNHAELVERRKKTMGAALSDKEVAMLKALDTPMPVNFKDTPLRSALEYLQEKTGLVIIVDQGSLREANVDYDDLVSFKAPPVTVKTILRKVLGDRGLGYILKEGTVQVLTSQRARETMIIRNYPIDDLLLSGNNLGFDPAFYGPYAVRAQMAANVDNLIRLIQTSIEPSQWNINGGPASITFYEPSRSLIVRASAEMHYSLGNSMFGR